ncbi:YceI family protein [Chitinophaga agrisoli]|uniref:YceI family protein n=1 Tax=Chitinophaga agrisoli TaxID=2607653 RepID=A0A5B2VKZ5_9BACT|nr:YceI family protein [Chitinophaga agrisoli]KAA2238962.1 YceI family protein [Chitinophaga agrisoli]
MAQTYLLSTPALCMDKGHYTLTGNMTLHGVTKSVTFDLQYRGTVTNPQTNQPSAGFIASGTLNALYWGLAVSLALPC